MAEEDKFDKVEVAVKKTTKIVILIIGSIVTIALAIFLAWDQIGGKVEDLKSKPDSVVKDTSIVPTNKDTVIVIKPDEQTPVKNTPKKEEPKKEEPKKDIIDKTDDVIDKVNKLKKIGEGIK